MGLAITLELDNEEIEVTPNISYTKAEDMWHQMFAAAEYRIDWLTYKAAADLDITDCSEGEFTRHDYVPLRRVIEAALIAAPGNTDLLPTGSVEREVLERMALALTAGLMFEGSRNRLIFH